MPKSAKGGKGGKKKNKKFRYRKCVGECYGSEGKTPDFLLLSDDDDIDWQMSPFSHDRYNQDEIQRLERKGVKAKKQLEEFKRKLAGENVDEGECSFAQPKPTSKPSKKHTFLPAQAPIPYPAKRVTDLNCSTEILYQPYGPLIAPVRSYARPFNSKHSVYCYLGPSYFSAYRFRVPAPGMLNPVPCPEAPPPVTNQADLSYYSTVYGTTYVPLGP